MQKLPDFDSLADYKPPKPSQAELKSHRLVFFISFVFLILLAGGALICAFIIKNSLLASFVFLIMIFWLILTVIFVIKGRRAV